MAMNRFPCEKYASVELNQVAFPKTGMVVSQVPLGSDFSSVPCENGMWVVADKAAGVIAAPTAVTDKLIGIVYTAEKEYDNSDYGLKNHYDVEGDYPRVGLLGVGDTITTNCLQYNTSNFADDAALTSALEDLDTNALYVGIKAASAVPEILTAAPASGIYGKIVKYYTVPNGEKGVKYQIVTI